MSETTSPDDDYEERKRRENERRLEQSAAGREIGKLPKVRSPRRRKRCERDLRKYLETYHASAFPLSWSDDHLEVIRDLEVAVLTGTLKAIALPRGSGKTTIIARAVLWAILYGHHAYVFVVAADEKKSKKLLKGLKTELESNPLLLADFPEAMHAIRKLERIANRAKGQTYQGEPTRIEWTDEQVVLPTIAGSPSSGAIIGVGAILAAVRGAQLTMPDGRVLRPSLFLIDDFQTRGSARSKLQCHERLKTITADILGMVGPGEALSALCACTVIHRGDAADQLLDRQANPEWGGVRKQLLESFPKRMDLWERYYEIRSDELRAGRDGSAATEFYRANRRRMRAGAKLVWAERFKPDELDALQHAMNLFFRDEEAFWSEYQNDPRDALANEESPLAPEDVAHPDRLNSLERRTLPVEATKLVAFVDVQQTMLWYGLLAVAEDFSGWLVDYGAWPDQGREYFTLADARETLEDRFPRAAVEGRIYAGLSACVDLLVGREWPVQGGGVSRVDRLLIDAGNWTDTVYRYCRQSPHGSTVMPSHGRGLGPTQKPFAEYARKPGDRNGHHWQIPASRTRRGVRHALIDVNHWKSFVHARFAVPLGDPGAWSLWGKRAELHRMLGEHVCSEYCNLVTDQKSGRTVPVWSLRPEKPDNHLLDVLVGCAAAASIEGCRRPEHDTTGDSRRPPVKWSDVRRRKRSDGRDR